MSVAVWNIGDAFEREEEILTTHRFQFSFELRPQHFEQLKEAGEIINSPTFNGDPKYGDEWRVQIRHTSPNAAKFFLQLVHSESKEEVNTTYKICCLDGAQKVRWAGPVKNETFLEGGEKEIWDRFGLSLLSNPQSQYLVDGSIRFCVQVSTQRLESKPETGKNIAFVTEQLKSFLINENFADVVLTGANCRFSASKIILSAHSPVFFAMFNSEMMESEANAVVKIEDFSDDIIQGFLEFVYTGETKSLEENAGELLKIGDKYQVLGLKAKCEQVLLKNLKIENAVDILVLAHLHSAEHLKSKILSFVNKNIKDLRNTESYGRMKKEYPQLGFDFYENSMN